MMPWRTLLIGTPEKMPEKPEPTRVSSPVAARKAFGEKSQLASMVRAYVDAAGITPEVWCLPVADASKAGAAFAATPEVHYNSVVLAFDDAKAIIEIADELKKRGGPIEQADGVLYVATNGNPAPASTDDLEDLRAFGESFDTECVVLIPCPSDDDAPVWAAAFAGTVSLSAGIDPARPFQTLVVPGLRASKAFSRRERESLLRSGVSTWTRSISGDVVIERLITTYRKNAAGADDEAYLDLTSVLTLSYLRYSFRTYFLTKYPRHKLADDDVIVEPGAAGDDTQARACRGHLLVSRDGAPGSRGRRRPVQGRPCR